MKFLRKRWKSAAIIFLSCMFLLSLFHWTVNRVYVPEGYSLLLRYKGPLLFGERKMAKPGYFAQDGEIGILEKMVGPGRHFYCPIWWETTVVPDTVIKTGEVGVVTSKIGEPLQEGTFLVDGDLGKTGHKGIVRKVLTPGRYRINPYGYEVKVVQQENINGKSSGWVSIPTGYVGVVTNLTDNPLTGEKSGIQDKVLPPGLYPFNPREKQVDIVEIGYRETTINIATGKKEDESGEPLDGGISGGINFPSKDGFKIHMDFTAIWGLMPDQAPNAIRKFGNVDMVENKVVSPQVESICRQNGSEYSAVELLVGDEREVFQNKTLEEFQEVLKSKNITMMYGLVRHIYIPKEVRLPIQTAFIADELKITREQEQKSARMEAELREAERKVELESARVKVDTKKLVAQKLAEGQKQVGETIAETRKLVAAIDKETADLESKAILLLGKADSDGKKLIEEAKSNRFKLAVQAFGTPGAYNDWTFATGLPDNIELKMFYAGKGTLWTDLKDALRIMVPNEEPKSEKK